MRRDYFALDVSNVDAAGMPTVHVDFEGPEDQLRERLDDPDGDPLTADDVDIAYRIQGDIDAEEASGVVAVTNRVTGEFILELNADADTVFEFIGAAREYGKGTDDERRYTVRVTAGDETLFEAEKATFLVYDGEGELRRGRSLIPSGVQL